MDWKNNIQRLSNLSRILINGDEAEEIGQDMSSIMKMMDTLRNVELPPEEISEEGVGINALREDSICESLEPALLISQCAGKQKNCFAIPRTLI